MVGGDNTTGMKVVRAYKRLIISILENHPLTIQRMLLLEYETLVGEHVLMGDILKDSRKYVVHYQSGRAMLLCRDTPLSKKVCADGDEAHERSEDRILRRRMQNRKVEEYID